MIVNRYNIDWDQDYYSNPDGRWCFAEEAIEAIATKDAEIARLAAEVTTLRARCDTLARLVYLYRHGVPLGHQPHMIASEADKALKEPTDG